MSKLKWGNGESNTGGSPYVVERGISSASVLEYNDRQNIKTGKKVPFISFGELAAKFDTDPQYLKNALEKRDLIINDSSDMVSEEDAKFIEHTFSSVYKKEVRDAERAARREKRWLTQQARNEKMLEIKEQNKDFIGEKPSYKETLKYRDLLD